VTTVVTTSPGRIAASPGVKCTSRPSRARPLIRAVAYESQLKSDRAEWHRRLAAAIQERAQDALEENASLIAEHLEAAGELHAAYGWIVIYLVLRALAAVGLVAEPLAVHALTIGAIVGMTMGMMARTARGHTGRPLTADRFEVTCFVLIQLAVVVRVFGGILLPAAYLATVMVSGICWSAAFALFAVRYWPVLSRARIDGKAG